MKRIFAIVGIILFLLAVAFFSMPMGHKSFEELYTGEEKFKLELEKFRTYPTKSITVNELEWNYLDIGSGTQTLLMLHGMGGAYDIWFQQIQALKFDIRIIAVTYPAGKTLEELAAGVIHILDTEEIDKTNVIGSSLGGYLTQFLLKNHADRLEKVIIGNSFPPNHQLLNKNEGLAKTLPYVPEWLLMKTFRGNIKKVVVPAANDNPLVEAYLLEQDYGLMSKAQFIGRLNCVLQYFEPANPDSIIQEMLIIDADNDPLIPANLRDSLKMIYSKATVKTFHNTGHFTYLNAPNEYTEVIQNFVLGNNWKEEKQISTLINEYYFKGRKQGNVELLAKAFDKNTNLTTVVEEEEILATLQEYLAMVAEKGSVSCKTDILMVDVQGNIGVAKTRFDYGPVVYIDFLTLEKRNGNWKIISKLYTKE